jgi:hypothetical protein
MTQPVKKLGSRLYRADFRVRAVLPAAECAEKLQKAVRFVKMTPMPEYLSTILFPLADGQGGQGYTIFLPLVESYIVADAWPEMGHIFISLASCRPFNARSLAIMLRREFGPVKKTLVGEL